MRHVDEGTLHAWVEGQIGDPLEAARVEEHLRRCESCRDAADDARALIAGAAGLLAGVAPESRRPSFDTLVSSTGTQDHEQRLSTRQRRRTWLMPAAWAATVVCAAGLGWAARDLLRQNEQARPPAAANATVVERPAVARTVPVGSSTAQTAQTPSTSTTPSSESASRVRASRRAAPPAPVEALAVPAPALAGRADPETPAHVVSGQPSLEAASRTELLIPDEAVKSFPTTRTYDIGASLTPPPRVGQAFAAPLPASSSAGGRMQFSGERATVMAETPVVDIMSARSARPVLMPFVRNTGEWRQVPRTEAAVLSKMPLYGVQGMTPSSTMVSADHTAVRTFYRLSAAETLEIWQGPGVSSLSNAQVDQPFSTTPVEWLEGWSVSAGEVQLLLRSRGGESRLASFARQLRID